jgi:hypothetical protein
MLIPMQKAMAATSSKISCALRTILDVNDLEQNLLDADSENKSFVEVYALSDATVNNDGDSDKGQTPFHKWI